MHENLSTCLDIVRLVEIFSSNQLELISLFEHSSEDFSKTLIEELSLKVVQAGVGRARRGTIIIRAREHGCLVVSTEKCPTWSPPYYHADGDSLLKRKIVDDTGAGNAFLDGYAMGFNKTQNVISAACYGTVSASFVLKQIGTLKPMARAGVSGEELWNGKNPRRRLEIRKSKLKSNHGVL